MESKSTIAFVVAVAALLAVASVAVTEQGQEETLASFRVEKADLDLGTVVAGEDAVATYTFHNDTDEDVKIIRAKPS